jgi:tetratricopeptide (TPR) repeat protein
MAGLTQAAPPPESDFARFNRIGAQAYKDGKYEEAAEALVQAYNINPVAALLFNIARAFERAGKDDEAIRYYQRYVDAQGTELETVKKAARSLDQLHRKEAERKAAAQEQAAKDQAEKDRLAKEQAAKDQVAKDEAARLAKEQAEKDKARQDAEVHTVKETSRPGYALPTTIGVVAVVAAAAGLSLGIVAKGKATAFDNTYDPTLRPQLRSSAQAFAIGADISYGIAVVAAVASIILFVRASSSSSPSATPQVAIVPLNGGAAATWSASW